MSGKHITALIADGPGKGQWLALKNRADVPYCVEVVHDEWVAKPYNLYTVTLGGRVFWVAALGVGSTSMADIERLIFDGEGQ